jgi:excisionase family DNA binding protein
MQVEEILKERVYTLTEVAAMLGVSYTMARNIVRKISAKHIRIGRMILIPESEVKRLIELRKQKIIKKFGSGDGS